MRNEIIATLKQVMDGIEKVGNNTLNPLDLTLTQCAVLGFLHEQENFSAPLKKIEKFFNVSQATMQGIVTRLESKGFLRLEDDIHDKRMKTVVVSELGTEVWEKAEEKRIEAEKIFFADIDESERVELMRLLFKIQKNLEGKDE